MFFNANNIYIYICKHNLMFKETFIHFVILIDNNIYDEFVNKLMASKNKNTT